MFITNLYPPQWLGGYEILCGLVADALARRGHEVHVLTSGVDGAGAPPATHASSRAPEPESDADGAPVNVHRALRLTFPFDRPRPPFLRWQARAVARFNQEATADLLARVQPDVVVVWSLLRLTPTPARIAAQSGVPVCHSLNDEHLSGYLPTPVRGIASLAHRVIEDLFLRDQTLRGLDLRRVTCISERLKQNLVRQGVPVAQARVIYQGIALERFAVHPPEPHPRLRLLYVGQLHAYKGAQTLVQAAHALAATEAFPLSVTIAGSGPAWFERQLRAQIDAGPADIRMIGRVAHERIGPLYAAHDIFVFPSIWEEPFGLTPLEAMACGMPVVSTRDGGHGECLVDGENALVFRGGDATHLACRIRELALDPALRARLGAAGRATVEQRFGFERYLDELEAFIESTCTHGAQPSRTS